MNRKAKILYKEWLFIIIAWIFITNFFSWLVLVNLGLFMDITQVRIMGEENVIAQYLSSGYQYLEGTLFGIFFGFAFGLINHFISDSKIRRKSFGKIILIESTLYFGALVGAFIIVYLVLKIFDIFPKDVELLNYANFITLEYILSMGLYFAFFIILTNFILQVNKKFGPGNLAKMMLGTYHTPKEEHKIFLFLDLKDSTGIAEKLGHKTYSQFLANCYYDLTDIILKYKADVYQYVGDEVVLFWDVKTGLEDLNCIKTYFAFEKKISGQKEFYFNNYGILPEFKCGMDMGYVTAAEVGDIKREIAYHGDVLNTAARIQEQCKQFGTKVLISEHIEEKLPSLKSFQKEYIGEVKLRGKREDVKIFSITYS
ncbi:MAG: adenylate/guanylate cyclase domain-containing protein [Ignavibacteriae bacterium]|nr:adenylate/guanylate cyclase domain-containing protein [Ignavibacteriota bacterium]NOG98607.1 adenylate/guanylate cyclase domain-containing protein [Ignavibacteriota bacterium]